MASEINLTLKLMVNRSTNKVLFAEASKEVVDFLFGLLEMPICSIFKLLKKEKVAVGSLGMLFESIEVLDDTYFQSNNVKAFFLNPVFRSFSASYSSSLLPPPPPVPENKTYYDCPNVCLNKSNNSYYVSDSCEAICPGCNKKLSSCMTFVKSPLTIPPVGYVKSMLTYTILDDLSVAPMSGFSSVNLVLNHCGTVVIGDLEEMVVNLGLDEGLKLLKTSLHSTTVLSDVFLPTKSHAAK